MYKVLHAAAVLLLAGAAGAADKSGYSLVRPVPAGLLRELNTDRPDQTESPYTVDAGHFQIEMDLVHHGLHHDTSGGGSVRTKDWSIAPINLKVGLLNQVDLQLMIDPYVQSRVEDRLAGTTDQASGLGDLATRLKINCWGNDGGKTAFALMPFIKWPLSASGVRNGETEGGISFILGFKLPAGWNSAAMTEVDFVSDGAGGHGTEWINTITFAHDLTTRLGGYLEIAAVTGDVPGFKWRGQFDAGLTYALTASTQLDLGCNFGVTNSAPDYQPFVGLSHRF